MHKLGREDLFSLESYAEVRSEFRARVIAHKRHRRVALGPHIMLQFEDRLTVQYQIQEMLRVERIFARAGIEEELSAYNPLIPDGSNLKATMMIEYPDAVQRQAALTLLRGIEDRIWLEVGDRSRIFAIADEDLDRSNEIKTSAVHFLRFELTAPAAAEFKTGAAISLGTEHEAYTHGSGPLDDTIRAALVEDLN